MRGSIIKRGSNYSIIIDLGRDQLTGKRQQKWFSGYTSKRSAEKDLPKLLIKAENGELVPSNNIRLKDFLKDWLENHSKKQDLSPTTIDGYNNIINNHVILLLGDLKLQDIKTYNIQQYFDKKFKTLSAKTLTQHYRVLHKAFDYACRIGLIEKNPCKNVDRPKEKKIETKVLNIEETKELLDIVNGHWYYGAPVTLALLLGLRRGEVLGLRWEDINFKDKTITINQTLEKVKGKFVFKEPKTEKSKRTIAITDDIVKILNAHKKQQMKLQIAFHGEWQNKYNLVCTRDNGKPITPTVLSTGFQLFLKKHKLPSMRFHDLRHTNATLMLAAGVSAKVAGNRLGHSNIKTTLDLYSHVLEHIDRDAAEKLDSMLK